MNGWRNKIIVAGLSAYAVCMLYIAYNTYVAKTATPLPPKEYDAVCKSMGEITLQIARADSVEYVDGTLVLSTTTGKRAYYKIGIGEICFSYPTGES